MQNKKIRLVGLYRYHTGLKLTQMNCNKVTYKSGGCGVLIKGNAEEWLYGFSRFLEKYSVCFRVVRCFGEFEVDRMIWVWQGKDVCVLRWL